MKAAALYFASRCCVRRVRISADKLQVVGRCQPAIDVRMLDDALLAGSQGNRVRVSTLTAVVMFAGASPSATDFMEKRSSHSASFNDYRISQRRMTYGQARGAGKVFGILTAGASLGAASPSRDVAGHPRPARPG